MATLHTRGVGGRGLITPCPRFVGCRCGDVEGRGREREPLPGVSCIGDRLWGRRCSKGGRVNRTLHVLKGPCRRNFQRWKKSHVNFHRPNLHRYSVGQVFPRFIRFFFFFFSKVGFEWCPIECLLRHDTSSKDNKISRATRFSISRI